MYWFSRDQAAGNHKSPVAPVGGTCAARAALKLSSSAFCAKLKIAAVCQQRPLSGFLQSVDYIKSMMLSPGRGHNSVIRA